MKSRSFSLLTLVVPLMTLILILSPSKAAAFPFSPGEVIRFQIKVFGLHVGYQDMKFTGPVMLNGRRVLHAVADTRSLESIKSAFNYSLHDVIEVWMDPVTLLPIRVYKDIQEGSWTDKVTIDIDQNNRTALYRDKRNPNGVRIPLRRATLDILSLVYYVRAQQAQPGTMLSADYIVDNKQGVKDANIAVRRADPLPVGGRSVPTLLFEQRGGQGVRVRMTDDANRVPVSITVGTFKVYGYDIDIVGSLVKVTRGQ
ncbi:MAG TPA: DUF3108 domain-containing protein [Spirochaetota bacterium]|nr:DUF3108 domain-containing protein [Spirochaetota bacterium]